MTRKNKLLKAYLEETDASNLPAYTRTEKMLKKLCCGETCEDVPAYTATEKLLQQIVNKKNYVPKDITFTVCDVEYQAKEGMTWWEWCNSDYNTSKETEAVINCELGETGFLYINGTVIETAEENISDRQVQYGTTVIKNGGTYIRVYRD